ncbi:MAG: magnesium/cobalt transporter CorA [Planctomycetota bacterium]
MMAAKEKARPNSGQAVGLPPGTLVHVGDPRTATVGIRVIDYSPSDVRESEVSPEQCGRFLDSNTVTWINVDGIHDLDLIGALGREFKLHPLLLEDVANTRQRPKVDEYEGRLFIVLKMLYVQEDDGSVDAEQVSLVVGRNFVISFQERPGDVFEPIRDRIRRAKGRIREAGADYLAYALIDAVVDNYFLILEGVGDRIEELEESVVSDPDTELLRGIRRLKREAMLLRRSVWPLREVVSALCRGESPLVRADTLPYLRDVYDHTIQVADTIESFRDLIGGLRDAYLTVISNRMNEVMKVLTIIATIFIPLTFVAGIYGMNFEHMPELKYPWAYPAVWAVMLLVAIGMVIYFKTRKWL